MALVPSTRAIVGRYGQTGYGGYGLVKTILLGFFWLVLTGVAILKYLNSLRRTMNYGDYRIVYMTNSREESTMELSEMLRRLICVSFPLCTIHAVFFWILST